MSRTSRIVTQARRGVLVTAAVLVVAGCAASDPAEQLEPTLAMEVVGTDTMRFEPAAHAVPVGDAIELVLHAEDAVEHDYVVEGAAASGQAIAQDGEHSHDEDELDGDDLHIAHAYAGEQARSLFVIDQPGVYSVYCSIPGHREAGMTGTLAVLPRER